MALTLTLINIGDRLLQLLGAPQSGHRHLLRLPPAASHLRSHLRHRFVFSQGGMARLVSVSDAEPRHLAPRSHHLRGIRRRGKREEGLGHATQGAKKKRRRAAAASRTPLGVIACMVLC